MGSLEASDPGVSDKLLWSRAPHVIGVLKGATLGSHCSLLGADTFKWFLHESGSLGISPILALIDEQKEAI